MFKNIYARGWNLKSGMNELQALAVCQKYHWAYVRNRSIVAANKRIEKGAKTGDPTKEVTVADAPDINPEDSTLLYPEAVVFLIYQGDPIWDLNKRNDSSDVADEATRLTAKGRFPSRNQQRADKCKRLKQEMKNKEKNTK